MRDFIKVSNNINLTIIISKLLFKDASIIHENYIFFNMGKKIIITGATGLIGRRLCDSLAKSGNEITIFTTNPGKAAETIKYAKEFVDWNFLKINEWEKIIDGTDAVIHLAGASIAGKRWDEDYKKRIYDSRIISTKNLVTAIGKAQSKPSIFITASATGYYGNAKNNMLTEDSNSGNDFLADVCTAWELAAAEVEQFLTCIF